MEQVILTAATKTGELSPMLLFVIIVLFQLVQLLTSIITRKNNLVKDIHDSVCGSDGVTLAYLMKRNEEHSARIAKALDKISICLDQMTQRNRL